MPKEEKIPTAESYQPHCNSLTEVVENKAKLSRQQILQEIIRLKYQLNQETMDLMAETDSFDPKTKQEFIRLISLVAMAAIPDVEKILNEENKLDLLNDLKFIKQTKKNLKK